MSNTQTLARNIEKNNTSNVNMGGMNMKERVEAQRKGLRDFSNYYSLMNN